MRRLISLFDRTVFEEYRADPRDLAIYRVFVGAYLLLAVVPVAPWAASAPPAFFRPPPGLPSLFVGFPAPNLLIGLNGLLVVLLVMLIVGWRTPAASVGVTATLLLLKSWEYGTGKIDHDILLVLAPGLLAWSGWGATWSVDGSGWTDAPTQPGWPRALLAWTVALAMASAGGIKLITGWLDPTIQSTYGHLVVNNLGSGRETWLSAILLPLSSPLVWEPADWAATLMELSFLIAFFRLSWMRVAISAACIFHLGVWLLFDIVFAPNPVAYAAFLSFGPLRGLTLRRPLPWVVAALAGAGAVVGLYRGTPAETLLHLQLHEAIVVAGAILGAVYLARSVPRRRARAEAELLRSAS